MGVLSPVIHLQPVEAWGFYAKNRKRLEEELVEIASNEATNTSVCMTDEGGIPCLYVYRDDKKIFQSECSTIYTAEQNLRMIYAKYLTNPEATACGKVDDNDSIPNANDEDGDTPPISDLDAMSDAEFQGMVDEREDVIYAAVQDLIEALTEDAVSAMEFECGDDDSISDIVDHIVEYLAIDCGFRIRRPMTVIDDESGLNVRTEYPYEEFDFSKEELHG